MKSFKRFIAEGDVIQFPKKEPPPSLTASEHIKNQREVINKIKPDIENIAYSPIDKQIVNKMSPTITNQYKGTDVHHLDQLHQHITYANEDIHPDPTIAQERKDFAKNIATVHKDYIVNELDRRIGKASKLLDGHHKSVKQHFNSAGGIIGHLKRMRDTFNNL